MFSEPLILEELGGEAVECQVGRCPTLSRIGAGLVSDWLLQWRLDKVYLSGLLIDPVPPLT